MAWPAVPVVPPVCVAAPAAPPDCAGALSTPPVRSGAPACGAAPGPPVCVVALAVPPGRTAPPGCGVPGAPVWVGALGVPPGRLAAPSAAPGLVGVPGVPACAAVAPGCWAAGVSGCPTAFSGPRGPLAGVGAGVPVAGSEPGRRFSATVSASGAWAESGISAGLADWAVDAEFAAGLVWRAITSVSAVPLSVGVGVLLCGVPVAFAPPGAVAPPGVPELAGGCGVDPLRASVRALASVPDGVLTPGAGDPPVPAAPGVLIVGAPGAADDPPAPVVEPLGPAAPRAAEFGAPVPAAGGPGCCGPVPPGCVGEFVLPPLAAGIGRVAPGSAGRSPLFALELPVASAPGRASVPAGVAGSALSRAGFLLSFGSDTHYPSVRRNILNSTASLTARVRRRPTSDPARRPGNVQARVTGKCRIGAQ